MGAKKNTFVKNSLQLSNISRSIDSVRQLIGNNKIKCGIQLFVSPATK